MPDVKVSQLLAQSPATVAAGAALWTNMEHIAGLDIEVPGPSSLRITSGSAYLVNLGYAIDVPAAITKAGLSLAPATLYHVYLFSTGVPDVEIVTTAPASPYRGSARTKTGDTSRRYLGSVFTDASGGITNVACAGGKVAYQAPPIDIYNGTDIAATTVSLAAITSPSARSAQLRIRNASNRGARLSNPDASTTGPPNGAILLLSSDSFVVTDFVLSSQQQITCWLDAAATSGSLIISCLAYTYGR